MANNTYSNFRRCRPIIIILHNNISLAIQCYSSTVLEDYMPWPEIHTDQCSTLSFIFIAIIWSADPLHHQA